MPLVPHDTRARVCHSLCLFFSFLCKLSFNTFAKPHLLSLMLGYQIRFPQSHRIRNRQPRSNANLGFQCIFCGVPPRAVGGVSRRNQRGEQDHGGGAAEQVVAAQVEIECKVSKLVHRILDSIVDTKRGAPRVNLGSSWARPGSTGTALPGCGRRWS